MSPSTFQNPSTPSEWWKKAKIIVPDPAHLDILTYEAHSASKFDETDFIYLKALWKNKSVIKFHVSDYVRAEYVRQAHEFIGRTASPPSEQGQPVHSLRQSMITFINTAADPFRPTDPVNAQLGAFLVTKWLLEQTRPINDEGQRVGGDTLKIVRRSARLKQKREAEAATEREEEGSFLNEQMEALTINRSATPPAAPQTPAFQMIGVTAAMADTHELDVISPESMGLETVRSEDEEIVNSALVNLLAAITLCSGIMSMKGREGLQWVPKRQCFSLGSAKNTVCEARTDGLLRNLGNSKRGPLAILEVKPYMRHSSQPKIEWQEACQMAAWISTTLSERTAEKRRAGCLSTGDNGKGR